MFLHFTPIMLLPLVMPPSLSCCVPFCTLGNSCLVCLHSCVVVYDLCASTSSKKIFSTWVQFNFAMHCHIHLVYPQSALGETMIPGKYKI